MTPQTPISEAAPIPELALEQTAARCRNVTKEFGTGENKVFALNGVDVDIPYGEMTLLVGPSGCGKTTLISVIAGLLDPTAGEVVLLGQNRRTLLGGNLVKFRAKNVGFVFQQYNLLPALTAAENVAVPLLIAGASRRQAVQQGADMLQRVGLGHRCDARPAQLSGGQQQRVAIARALIHNPRLLVCDEPTAALDAAAGRNVMELLHETTVRPDRAVIVVTHDSRVYEFGDRVISMSDGRITDVELGHRAVQRGTPLNDSQESAQGHR